MSNSGLSMMLITEGLVTLVTMYFFYRILFSKKQENNEYSVEEKNVETVEDKTTEVQAQKVSTTISTSNKRDLER